MKRRVIYAVIGALIVAILLSILVFLQQTATPQKQQPPTTIPLQQASPEIRERPLALPLNYQQIGVLTANETDKEPIVLALFGRKIRNERWQYYTATDKTNMLRIPLKVGNRECEDTIGCSEVYTGDKLVVDIYQGREFTATIYKIDAPRYFADRY